MTKPPLDRIQKELAGFAFKRPLSAERIAVPASVELIGGNLVWSMFAGDKMPSRRFPRSGLLWRFVELGHPSVHDRDILKFAQAWGVLGICEHGEPNYHPRYDEALGRRAVVLCVPPGGFGLKGREAVAAWRPIAARLRTLIELAAQVAHGGPGDNADWIESGTTAVELDSWQDQIGPRRGRLATLLNRQLTLSNSRLELRWSDPTPEIRLGGNGLYSALIQQLVLEVSDAVGLAFCWKCRVPHRRTGLRREQRSFCKKCREAGAPEAAASQDYRDRGKAREMSKLGADPETIAESLGRPLIQVEKWLGRKSRRRSFSLWRS